MPYITKNRQLALWERPLISIAPTESGELNYCITRLCQNFINAHGTRYSVLNDIIGVLECAKQEFYRRIAVPYEDKKIKENGDVF